MNIIVNIYKNAIIVIINGDGTMQFMLDENNDIKQYEVEYHNEPSKQIEYIIEKNRDKPIFITGLTCIGMSVTLINEQIGNFDNVIYAH